MKGEYIEFTKDMIKDYTILIPTMLPIHFKLVTRVLSNYGYKTEILDTSGKQVVDTGLKYVHNDTCYPAILVIGQLINALQSGKYNINKIALMLFQTGGGCRASNYISLLRKALKKAGLGHIPVISFGIAGIEKHSGMKLTAPRLIKMIQGVLYGDLLMSLVNQVKPYEKNKGEAVALSEKWMHSLEIELARLHISKRKVLENYRQIIKEFGEIPYEKKDKIKVGIVGEIFVKYSPLGNNNLEEFLYNEGAEVVVPGLLDFLLYCIYNPILDAKLYGINKGISYAYKAVLNVLLKKQQQIIDAINAHGRFMPPTPFMTTVSLVKGYIGIGTKMGEGWLLTAEMLELAHQGVENIICTQPFGCLPNHICGKGMMKPIKEKNKNVNIVAIDYDAGATQVNQENRIKLMLANAIEKQ
ncbi:MAG: 2-hydroxyacyl-CoA dehydratase [Clostridia bacterium]|nr:2-hydroxyacyl-CoA dehydratase [Clostridia bacterium]